MRIDEIMQITGKTREDVCSILNNNDIIEIKLD